MKSTIGMGFVVLLAALPGCGSDEGSERGRRYREALDQAELSLADSVAVAEGETAGGVGVRAVLLLEAQPVYLAAAAETSSLTDVRIDIVTGEALLTQSIAGSVESCGGAVSLAAAIASAEAEVGGNAVAIEPDDDGFCNREVKVVAGEVVWEVKVAPDGSVIEVEEDDEAEDDEADDDD
jgi:uncharacterized membrane protein YkoI